MSSSEPKILRNPAETRRKILEVAFDEIYCHGFKGTSTNTIIAKMEMTRGAFFHHFPTKDDLGYALIDEVIREMILQRWITPVASSDNTIDGIFQNFAQLIDDHRDEHVLCGCPLNNLVQEMSDRPGFQKRIQSVMEMWIRKTEALLARAKKSGHLIKDINIRQLAEFIVACQEAAFSMGKALNSRTPMYTILKSLEMHINLLNRV